MRKAFKIYGLRNTGTNWLKHLMLTNYDVDYYDNDIYGWKHGPPSMFIPENVLVIVLVKDPYSWVISTHNRPHAGGHGKKLKEFSQNEAVKSEFSSFSSMVHRYAFMYDMYYDHCISRSNFVLLRYEDLLKRPDHIRSFERKFGIKKKKGDFDPVNKKPAPKGHLTGSDFKKRDYYLNKEWREHLMDETREFVNKVIPTDLFIKLGYDKL